MMMPNPGMQGAPGAMPPAGPGPTPPMAGTQDPGAAPAEMTPGDNPVTTAFKTLMMVFDSLQQAGDPTGPVLKGQLQQMLDTMGQVGSGNAAPAMPGPESGLQDGMSMGPSMRSPSMQSNPVDTVSGRAPNAKPMGNNSKMVPVM